MSLDIVTKGELFVCGADKDRCFTPEILAPAGDLGAALAALAAGADAVYLGLKLFSARMLAENFSILELARFAELARKEKKKIYVAMNSFLKPNELGKALRQMRRLVLDVSPDALIVQDMALPLLAKEAGFTGEFHFSTLANVGHQKALEAAKAFGAARIVLPRELSLQEVRLMNDACPTGTSLEVFVHGALCYCVSGRCWWSSYLGGKSGLRGRCVQPCRRVYTQRKTEGRFFSCLDLSVNELTQELLPLQNVASWKIEGRRKSPHYVYHTTKAYCLLRDHGSNLSARREAEDLLAFALGRLRVNLFADGGAKKNEKATPLASFKTKRGQSASGLLCGHVSFDDKKRPLIQTLFSLQAQDCLRVGYEDEPWHTLCVLQKQQIHGNQVFLSIERGRLPKERTPVFLIDRKSLALQKIINHWRTKLDDVAVVKSKSELDYDSLHPPVYKLLNKERFERKVQLVSVDSVLALGKDAKKKVIQGVSQALWLGRKTAAAVSKTVGGKYIWWLPPIIWPDEEAFWEQLIRQVYQKGARHFVCNSPWQIALLPKDEQIQAHVGPFCSISNAGAVEAMRLMGYKSVAISPELGKEDILSLPKQCSLPLAFVLSGYWPMGLSRHGLLAFDTRQTVQSPKKEEFWLRRYGQNVWIYPAWPLDLTEYQNLLQKAGYRQFIRLEEYPPREFLPPKRSSQFNWDLDVL